MATLSDIRSVRKERKTQTQQALNPDFSKFNVFPSSEEAQQREGIARKTLKNLNLGLARILGVPHALAEGVGMISDAITSPFFGESDVDTNPFPTGEEIQDAMAKFGMTFPAGEQPEDVVSRTIQNVGSTAPFFGMKSFQTGASLLREGMASIGAALGGKIGEHTEFGQKHPILSRALGELFGGVGTVGGVEFLKRGGTHGVAAKGIGKTRGLIEKGIDPTKRASKQTRDVIATSGSKPGISNVEMARARFQKTAEMFHPRAAEKIVQQRNVRLADLKKRFALTGNADDARAFLEAKREVLKSKASNALDAIKRISDPAIVSEKGKAILVEALGDWRKAETRIWKSVDSSIKINGAFLERMYMKLFREITEGGKFNVSGFVRQKMGSVIRNKQTKRLEMVGGELFNRSKRQASARAIHQFYSELGDEWARLARQAGSTKARRIVVKLREAALKDLDAAAGVKAKEGLRTTEFLAPQTSAADKSAKTLRDATQIGSNYRKAIAFSKELNNKFTKGNIGKVLGFARGETPSARRTIDVILGTDSEEAVRSINQALKASPKIKTHIENFLSERFAFATGIDQTGKINARNAHKFLKDNEPVLNRFFPELKKKMLNATKTQSSVDEFLGVRKISEYSPLVRDRAAAAIYLGADPGEEMRTILSTRGIERTQSLKALVKATKEDANGNAFRGLQTSFTNELLRYSSNEQGLIKGTSMLARLKDLRKAITSSNLFNNKEIERIKAIAIEFRKIEDEILAAPLHGGMINDLVARWIGIPARVLALKATSLINPGTNAGASLQIAHTTSKETQNFLSFLTNDEARNILIASTTDDELWKSLVRSAKELGQEEVIWRRIISKVKDLSLKMPEVPAAALAPAAATTAEEIASPTARDQERMQRVERLINRLGL